MRLGWTIAEGWKNLLLFLNVFYARTVAALLVLLGSNLCHPALVHVVVVWRKEGFKWE